MQNEKTSKIIEAIKNMTDHEADILEVFIFGFRAGRQVYDAADKNTPVISCEANLRLQDGEGILAEGRKGEESEKRPEQKQCERAS